MIVSRAWFFISGWALLFVTLILDNLVGTEYPSPQNIVFTILYMITSVLFLTWLVLFFRDFRRRKKRLCPDCGSRGDRNSWRPVGSVGDLEEYKFLCSNLECSRARDPWFVLESRKKRGSLRDTFFIVILGIQLIGLGALEASRRLSKVPRKLLRRFWLKHSPFADPRLVLVHIGTTKRFMDVDEYNTIMGQLEELQEATKDA